MKSVKFTKQDLITLKETIYKIDVENKNKLLEILDKLDSFLNNYDDDRKKAKNDIKERRKTNILYARSNPYKLRYFMKSMKNIKTLMDLNDYKRAVEQYNTLYNFAKNLSYMDIFKEAECEIFSDEEIEILNKFN